MQGRTRKNRQKTHVEASDEGEVFDAPSDTSESSVGNEPVAKAAPPQAKRAGHAGRAVPAVPSSTTPAAPGPSMVHDAQVATVALLQLFLPTTDSGRSNRAYDTKYFFPHGEVVEKGVKATKQICRACKYVFQKILLFICHLKSFAGPTRFRIPQLMFKRIVYPQLLAPCAPTLRSIIGRSTIKSVLKTDGKILWWRQRSRRQ